MWVGRPSWLGDKRVLAAVASSMVLVAVVGATITVRSVGWGLPESAQHPYNITFREDVRDEEGYCSGWTRYGVTSPHSFTIAVENLTWVYFDFVWSDEVGSPLEDPDVTLTLKSPNGTIIYNGPAPTTRTTWNVSLNSVPDDLSLMAENQDRAIEKAFERSGTNHTLGVGNWSWTLDVGGMPFARNIIRSGVNYQCWFGFGNLEAAASNGNGL